MIEYSSLVVGWPSGFEVKRVKVEQNGLVVLSSNIDRVVEGLVK